MMVVHIYMPCIDGFPTVGACWLKDFSVNPVSSSAARCIGQSKTGSGVIKLAICHMTEGSFTVFAIHILTF